MCNTCIHKIVCSKYIATGGVNSCEHHKEERKGRWLPINTIHKWRFQCDQCKHYVDAGTDRNFCPNCGADMRGNENGETE